MNNKSFYSYLSLESVALRQRHSTLNRNKGKAKVDPGSRGGHVSGQAPLWSPPCLASQSQIFAVHIGGFVYVIQFG